MDRIKKLLRSPFMTLAFFALAVVLLFSGSIGGARAALTYFSDYHVSRVELYSIGVSLYENGRPVSWRNYDDEAADGSWLENTGALLESLLEDAGDEGVKLDKEYPEALTVVNSGSIDEYVRVSVYRWWEKDGEKLRELNPSLIELRFLTDNGWIIDGAATTDERTVLYYTLPLGPGETSPALTDILTIRGGALTAATTTEESTELRDGRVYRTVTTTYDYDGARFMVEAEVDAVQTHNAEAAIRSAWGRAVTVSDGVLALYGGGGAS